MGKGIKVLRAEDLARKIKVHGQYEYIKREITSRSDFDDCYVAIYEIPPRKSNYPYHYHERDTEIFYIIQGKGILRTQEKEIEVSAGDVITVHAGIEGGHKLTNTSDIQPLKYIEFDTVYKEETIVYPDSNKVGVIIHNESSRFYREGKEVDYYDGE